MAKAKKNPERDGIGAVKALGRAVNLPYGAVNASFYWAAGCVEPASTYPGVLPRFDSTFNQPLSSSTTLSLVPFVMLATTG